MGVRRSGYYKHLHLRNQGDLCSEKFRYAIALVSNIHRRYPSHGYRWVAAFIRRNTDYDNVFVCGPCWWGTFPMAVFFQLEKLDFSGKKVMAVMTREGSGLGSCARDLKKLCTGATFGNGLAELWRDTPVPIVGPR